MNKYISIIALLACGALFTSCDKDTEGMTWTVYYPSITLEGESSMTWEAGIAFVEPGYEAALEGNDISDQVTVSTSMNLSNPQPGVYTITYSASNADGNTASATRTVYVWTFSDPIAGTYTVSTNSYRDYNGETPFGGYPVIVIDDGDGYYYVTDVLGGWYEYRAGYGSTYAMQADIYVDTDNTVYCVDSYIAGWAAYGYQVDGWEDGEWDPDTETLSWYVSMEGLNWQIYLLKD